METFFRESFWGQNDEQCNVFFQCKCNIRTSFETKQLMKYEFMTPGSSSNICRRAVWKEELSSKTVLKDSLTYNHQQHHHHPKHHHPHHHQTPFPPDNFYTRHFAPNILLHQTPFYTKHLFFSHTFSFAFRKDFSPSVFLFRIKPSGLKLPVPGKPGTPGVPGDRATGRRGVAGTMP